MNRSEYFDYIEEHLNILSTRINARGRLNILDLNHHSENFYAYFLNELFKWELKNENQFKANAEAIDLIDHTNKIVIQVSSTNTKTKIESALNKDSIKQHTTYTFKFISIANDADELRGKSYANPYTIKFDPKNDIIDKHSILKYILGLEIDDQRQIYDLIQKELGTEIDIVKLDTNLAAVINILAKENWEGNEKKENFNPFEINRKIDHNQLKTTKKIIEEYKVYHHKVEEKYKEFDLLGVNKSYSILQLAGRYYVEECKKSDDSDIVFLQVSDRLLKKVEESANFAKVEFEILALCIDILVVDAFIRCKIFENPDNYKYAAA